MLDNRQCNEVGRRLGLRMCECEYLVLASSLTWSASRDHRIYARHTIRFLKCPIEAAPLRTIYSLAKISHIHHSKKTHSYFNWWHKFFGSMFSSLHSELDGFHWIADLGGFLALVNYYWEHLHRYPLNSVVLELGQILDAVSVLGKGIILADEHVGTVANR
ncbi:hypothetical protein BDP27DRAFT_1332324, partial [Rhodocollybia butyracea]